MKNWITFFLMNREFVWKDFEILKIFHIKNMILFRLNDEREKELKTELKAIRLAKQ